MEAVCRSRRERHRPTQAPLPTPSSSVRGTTGWSRQTSWPMPGGTSASSRRNRSQVGLAAKLRAAGLPRLARFSLLPLRRLLEEEFPGPGGMLIAGSSLHADMSPESTGSAVFGWLLAMLGQHVGFPVPEGGAGSITTAL